MKNLIIAKLASYRDDLIEDVEYNVPITKIIMHKDYDSVRVTNDIALLEIKVPVKFNDYIGPVALPTLNQVPTQPKNCKAIGWGEYRYNKSQADIFYEKRLLCATSYDKENRFVGTCYGDSGGPMFCPEIINGRKVNVIFGVTSVSGGATCTEHPSGFANISALMGWLSSAAIQIKKERVGSKWRQIKMTDGNQKRYGFYVSLFACFQKTHETRKRNSQSRVR
uniref:Peptidase S1 domain-containing protein n=1 Tax=Romanomermis culicivorax TaxID=13658 RepID=A0A915ILD1_ROMCU